MTSETAESPHPEPGPVQPVASPLAAALARVQALLPRIGKSETGKVSGQTKDGKAFSYEYSYADLASVSAAIMPLLGEHGLAFTAFPTVTDKGLVLRYHLLHEAGEDRVGFYPLTGTTAQQLGGSITYARRYCLCAVTGIAPDEDDDTAGAGAVQEEQREYRRAQEVAESSAEYTHAANAVQGSWAAQIGKWDQSAAEKSFTAWSKGGTLREADARSLRAFAAYIDAMPPAAAGAPPEPPADTPRTQVPLMTGPQRGKLFKLMSEIGLDDKGAQLTWINQQLGTDYESRTKITFDNAKVLIDGLQQGINAPQSEPAE